ncbi:TetR/AcrR family transcriptional regulator [Enterococcus sp. CSURQ0835]|uniref:TetR/AcrR family transcriptional regulator n=1 Tax=Enterococcus sp. CSURQ0835 TaxID=2681394 RepID=UPI001358DB95|nr:TetR/AcrR family transcriptional regulator [Enterococcus sp. CSURQ0835]
MEPAYTDLRILKTRKKIKQAFITLIASRSLETITANDLITTAKISRGAFYRHFKDKEDLILQLQTEALAGVKQILTLLQNSDKQTFFFQLLNYLQHEGYLLSLLISTHGSNETRAQLKYFIQQHAESQIVPYIKTTVTTPIEKHYLIIYYSNAAFGVLEDWVNSGQKETPAEMMLILDKIVPLEFKNQI